ncbi:hypothetical protein C1J00_11355 [Streptomyces cahuitamycinicus]|uniref:Uncharacterized protein n=1 Tax=Streptomyces cahuitamycinicus TaxID=2070367 RepID=A0A2N8TSW7_9ACTN|nr:hypothetical protein C1J00_11355 [Streptomyces cahuitamycinicus]
MPTWAGRRLGPPAREDKKGKPLQDTFTVTREKGTWHLTVFTDQPAEPGKESTATDNPRS